MCGIIAFIRALQEYQKKNVDGKIRKTAKTDVPNFIEVILGIMDRLEYRGYDSCGISTETDSKIDTIKSVGKVNILKEKINKEGYLQKHSRKIMGIAHNRWATHGSATLENAHPVVSPDGNIVACMNGTIENFAALKEKMQSHGILCNSDVDINIVPILVQYYLNESPDMPELAVKKTFMDLEGDFAILIMIHGIYKIYAGKRGNPMVIGICNEGLLIASDQNSLSPLCDRFVFLEDNEMVCITPKEFHISHFTDDHSMERVESVHDLNRIVSPEEGYKKSDLNNDLFQIKADYPHYMLKEIMEQPNALNNTINRKVTKIGDIDIDIPIDVRAINFLACGTSLNAGIFGEMLVEDCLGIIGRHLPASEYVCRKFILDKRDLLIAISQSGETGDVRTSLKTAIASGASVAGIVNNHPSTIYNMCKKGICIHAGSEIAVASTKAFCCQMAAILLVNAFYCQVSKKPELNQNKIDIIEHLQLVPKAMQSLLTSDILISKCREVAAMIKHEKTALFLGRHYGYPVALEGALKLKEISYIHAEGYPSGEIKHGPIALIEKGVPVFLIVSKSNNDDIYKKMCTNIEEIKARQGYAIVISDTDTEYLRKMSDVLITVPFIHPWVQPCLQIIPLQLIAYYTSVFKGYNPDMPRNLAKSVTVH